MSEAVFAFGGVELVACLSGALYIPAARALAVADLHLEKGSGFARRGTPLPPYDSRASLAALSLAIARFSPRLVVCLGDSFDDAAASARLGAADAAALRDLVCAGKGGREWLWIAGNHDPSPAAGAAIGGAIGGTCASELRLGPLVLRHAAAAAADANVLGEISGHFHPKASVAATGRRFTARCFVSDGRRLIVPAFGAYAGGLDVFAPALAALLDPSFHVHLLGRGRVHLLASHRLVGGERRGLSGGGAP